VKDLRHPRPVVIGFGSLWVLAYPEAVLARIDPQTNTDAESLDVGGVAGIVNASNGSVWVATSNGAGDADAAIVRIDEAQDAVAGRYAVPYAKDAIATADPAALWVATAPTMSTGTVSSYAPVG
jgi:streptogramin lyase